MVISYSFGDSWNTKAIVWCHLCHCIICILSLNHNPALCIRSLYNTNRISQLTNEIELCFVTVFVDWSLTIALISCH